MLPRNVNVKLIFCVENPISHIYAKKLKIARDKAHKIQIYKILSMFRY